MRSIALLLLALAFLPSVEDPWPDSIGLELLAEAAGIGGVAATALFARAPRRRREKAIFYGGVWGFYLGAVFYLLSLLNQLISEL